MFKNIMAMVVPMFLSLVSFLPAEVFAEQIVLTTVTANTSGASTDGDVFVKLIGTTGYCLTDLDNPGHDDFQQGADDLFFFECPELGELVRIELNHSSHNSKGQKVSWHVRRIFIDRPDKLQLLKAEFDMWLMGAQIRDVEKR